MKSIFITPNWNHYMVLKWNILTSLHINIQYFSFLKITFQFSNWKAKHKVNLKYVLIRKKFENIFPIMSEIIRITNSNISFPENCFLDYIIVSNSPLWKSLVEFNLVFKTQSPCGASFENINIFPPVSAQHSKRK